MSAFTVVRPTVSKTATEVPLKLVLWKGVEAMEIFAGPRPVPLMIKMLPCAMGAAKNLLLAAFPMLVMVGAAESNGVTPAHRESKQADTLNDRITLSSLVSG